MRRCCRAIVIATLPRRFAGDKVRGHHTSSQTALRFTMLLLILLLYLNKRNKQRLKCYYNLWV